VTMTTDRERLSYERRNTCKRVGYGSWLVG
jgi:hypothetical protein